MKEMIIYGRPKAIEPTSIDKATPEQRFGVDMPSAKLEVYDEPTVSPLMRRLGYTRHPYACDHYRKRMYLGSKVRECMDCGERS